MANMLDELDEKIMEEGREVNVIAKQIKVEKDASIQILIWALYLIGLGLIAFGAVKKIYYIIPDNYLEQRVIVLQNTVKLVEKAIDLDKSVFSEISKLRSGSTIKESERNDIQDKLDKAYRGLNIAVENYPDLKSHMELRDAMQQNLYLQREITAAREVYNDNVGIWNREIFEWPFKKYVASKKEYTTRIPFIASQETKLKAKEVFF